MDVTVSYLGRALSVEPAVYGQLFSDDFVVTKESMAPPQYDEAGNELPPNVEQYDLKWYDKKPDGTEVFCTMAGFGPKVEQRLKDRGLRVSTQYLVDPELGEPDLAAVRDVSWRPRQQDVFLRLLSRRCGVVVCTVAFGKTFIIRQLARVYPKAVIIITVPQQDVCKKIYADLSPFLPGEVGFVGDGVMNWNRVNVVVSQSLHKCPKSANLILADECHSLCTPRYVKALNKFYRARIFGFSATYGVRGDKTDALNEAIFGPEIINIPYQEAEALGNVTPLRVIMPSCSEGPDITRTLKSNRAGALRYAIWRNETRNQLIAQAIGDAMRFLEAQDPQILVMTDTTEHAFLLGQLLPDYTIVHGDLDKTREARLRRQGVIVDGQQVCTKKQRDAYRRAFESGELRRAISTKVWKQGVDFVDLQILARADGAASAIDATQIPGRLSRTTTRIDKPVGVVIDVYDNFSAILKAFSKKRLDSYTANGWQVIRA